MAEKLLSMWIFEADKKAEFMVLLDAGKREVSFYLTKRR